MYETYIGGWWEITAAYFADAAALFTGNVTALSVDAGVGLALLVLGLIFAVVQRVTRVRRLLIPTILTILAPIVVIYVEQTIGWMGRILISMFGVAATLVWIGLVVGKAPNKLPIWLVGLGLISFVAYPGLITLVPLLL